MGGLVHIAVLVTRTRKNRRPASAIADREHGIGAERGEVGMKHPEYDSPFELTVSDITTQMARNIDEMSWQAVQRIGINVDKDKLLTALRQDAKRYRKAYANGYDTGYEKRDYDIIRCKNCKWYDEQISMCDNCWLPREQTFFCADAERKE